MTYDIPLRLSLLTVVIPSKITTLPELQGLTDAGVVENIEVEIVDTSKPSAVPSVKQAHQTEYEEQTSPTQDEQLETSEKCVILEGGGQVNYRFKYKGVEYLFYILLEINDPILGWLLVEDDGNNKYKLSINMRHSFFSPLIEKREFLPILMRMAIALVLAEIEAGLISPDGRIEPCAIRLKMNEMLESVRKGDDLA